MNNEQLFWMSFVNPELPQGERFLGVIITKASSLTDAIRKTHDMGINPGGEVMSCTVEDIPEKYHDRLLSADELISEDLGTRG